MTQKQRLLLKIAITLTGALGGYLYWYYVGCTSGACPIYTKWHLSTLYGALLGFVLSGLFIKNKKTETDDN